MHEFFLEDKIQLRERERMAQLELIVFDTLWLDGGAMFGSVPKTLWSRLTPPDELNRIKLVTRSVILRDGTRKVLVDTGVGEIWQQKHQSYYNFHHHITPSAISGITDVIITHLHFDHAGGLVRKDASGMTVLSFPDALHHCHKINWEQALNPSTREQASYLTSYLFPLKSATLNLLTEETSTIADMAIGTVVNGHTEGLMWIRFQVGETTYAFPSDLVPTSHHLSLPYIMGYDMCARATLKEKEFFLTKAVENSWVIIFQHDPDVAAATISRSAKGDFILKDIVSIDEYFPMDT